MSKLHKGNKHYFYGKHHTKETKQKLSEALKGRISPMKGKTLSEEHKQKLSEAHKGKLFTAEHKQKMSEANIGKHHTKETKQKISEANIGNKHCFGKHHTKETKQKISEAFKGKFLTKEHKQKMSEAHKGKIFTEEHKQKISEAHKGKALSEKTKQKIRISTMNRMIDNNMFPNFNKSSIQYFNILNRIIFNNDGQYGINEYCIPELGYWPDFISHKHKVIIEYDEEHHNRQTEKDEIRQNNIQAYYPDYAFVRIKEDNAKINILANLFANKIR